MKILIVDDAAIMRIVLKDILINHCHVPKPSIIEASGGREAIKMYRAEKPDIVLCDIMMPDMRGDEVVTEIIAFDPGAKIVMCTVAADASQVETCITKGASDYIVKPPNPNRVALAIKQIMGEA